MSFTYFRQALSNRLAVPLVGGSSMVEEAMVVRKETQPSRLNFLLVVRLSLHFELS